MRQHARRITGRRKHLGQVFLRDTAVIEQIVGSVRLLPYEVLLEIGPGRGALTNVFAPQASALYAIEIDLRYVHELKRRFTALPHVHIIHADARQYDYAQLPEPLVVVANLPYSVGLVILRRLLVFRAHLLRLTIMLQREVAGRLLASPGSSAYSAASVFFQYYATIQRAFEVSRYAFTPLPAVDSTVITLTPFTTLPYPSHHEPFLFRVLQHAFAHRRKTLRANLLAVANWSLTRQQLAELFDLLHLAENVRPQELTVSQFVQLADQLLALVPERHAPCRSQLQELPQAVPADVL